MDDAKRLKHNAYMRMWKKANKDKVNKWGAAYKQANPEKTKLWNKLATKNHPETARRAAKNYRANHPEKIKAAAQVWTAANRVRFIWLHARTRARKFKVPFSIVEEDIHVPDICPVLGLDLQFGGKQDLSNSPSVDRLIPDDGYTRENIRVISWRANNLKRNHSLESLRATIELRKRKPKKTPVAELEAVLAYMEREMQ